MGRLRRLVGDRRARSEEGVFIVQGSVLLADAVDAGLVREVYLRVGHGADAAIMEGPWSVHELDARTFDSVNDTVTPQGCMAVCSRPELGAWQGASESDWVLVADGIQDPGNLGTIFRSAEAAGARAEAVTPGTVDPWSPKAVRASAGAVMHVPVVEIQGLEDLSAMGFRIVGTTSHARRGVESVWEADLAGSVAVVVGNEAHGVSDDGAVEAWVSIPHHGRAESLNVGMAASVVGMVVAHRRAPGVKSRGRTAERD